MQPDVSFVIAAFNAEGSIARSVRSALDQREVSVEVIVVDDCSRDRTIDAALSVADTRVRVVALDRNRGPGGARNAGLAAGRGRWIAVLDADDAVHPDRLARLIARAASADAPIAVDNLAVVQETSDGPTPTPNPGGGEFGGSAIQRQPSTALPEAVTLSPSPLWEGVRGGGMQGTDTANPMFPPALLAQHSSLTLADFIAANLMFEDTFSLGYMKPVIERRFVEEHALLYPEDMRIGEDYIFLASALAKGGRCVVEPTPLYYYHIRAGSISRVLELHHVEAMLAADEALQREHDFDPAARAAQARRTLSLEEAAAFLSLVGHLKARAPLKAMGAALGTPRALRHLRMPIAARLRRLVQPFETRPLGRDMAGS